MEYDLDTTGGLMPQILALTAPPGSRDRSDGNGGAGLGVSSEPTSGLSAHPYFKRPGRGHNRDCCDACGEGGDLICCDVCPASFHLVCHDPPLSEEEIPLGEWGCHQCKVKKLFGDTSSNVSGNKQNRSGKRKDRDEDKTSRSEKLMKMSKLESGSVKLFVGGQQVEADKSVFAPLIIEAATTNPKQFVLPYNLTVPIAFPGESKNNYRINGRKAANCKKKPAHELDNGLVPLPAKLCFSCNRSCRAGPLLACDYCPLLFHLDCLDPPLTTAPTHRWMCPNHSQNFMEQKFLTTASITERVKLWERCKGVVDEAVIMRTFFNKIHRPRPLVRHKSKFALRDRIKVPEAIKEAYRQPASLLPALPPAHLRPLPPPILPPEYSPSQSEITSGVQNPRVQASTSSDRQDSSALGSQDQRKKGDRTKRPAGGSSLSSSRLSSIRSSTDEPLNDDNNRADTSDSSSCCSMKEDDSSESFSVTASSKVSDYNKKNQMDDDDLNSSRSLYSGISAVAAVAAMALMAQEENTRVKDQEHVLEKNSKQSSNELVPVSNKQVDMHDSSSARKKFKDNSDNNTETNYCDVKQCKTDSKISSNAVDNHKQNVNEVVRYERNGDMFNVNWGSQRDEGFENNNKLPDIKKSKEGSDVKIKEKKAVNNCINSSDKNCKNYNEAVIMEHSNKLDDQSSKLTDIEDIFNQDVESNETLASDTCLAISDNKTDTDSQGRLSAASTPSNTSTDAINKTENNIIRIDGSNKNDKTNAFDKMAIPVTGPPDKTTEPHTNISMSEKVSKSETHNSKPINKPMNSTINSESHDRSQSINSSDDTYVAESQEEARSKQSPGSPVRKFHESSPVTELHESSSIADAAGKYSPSSGDNDWPMPVMDISEDAPTIPDGVFEGSTNVTSSLLNDLETSSLSSTKTCSSLYPYLSIPQPWSTTHSTSIRTSGADSRTNYFKSLTPAVESEAVLLTNYPASTTLHSSSNTTGVMYSSGSLLPRVSSNSQLGVTSSQNYLSAPSNSLIEPHRSNSHTACQHNELLCTSDLKENTSEVNNTKPTENEISLWLSSLVSFQAGVAKLVHQSNREQQPDPLPSQSSAGVRVASPTAVSSVPPTSPSPPPILPSHPPTPPTTRVGRKQVLIPRISPTGSSSSSTSFFNQPPKPQMSYHVTPLPKTPAKAYLAHSAVKRSSSLSELLAETLSSLQSKLHASLAGRHSELLSSERGLMEVLAMQRLEQLNRPIPSNDEAPALYTAPSLPSHALLCPIADPPSALQDWLDNVTHEHRLKQQHHPPVSMHHRLLSVGKGSHNDVDLNKYGNCNYVTPDHACIVKDDYTGHYELVSYSHFGTEVDGSMFRCDRNSIERSSQTNASSSASHHHSSSVLQQAKELVLRHRDSYYKHGAAGYDFTLRKEDIEECEQKKQLMAEPAKIATPNEVIYRCNCARKDVRNVATPNSGWEGPAVLRHGSFLKFGCIKFVFSVVETASTGNWYTATEEAYKRFHKKELERFNSEALEEQQQLEKKKATSNASPIKSAREKDGGKTTSSGMSGSVKKEKGSKEKDSEGRDEKDTSVGGVGEKQREGRRSKKDKNKS